jgi:hypothetical protein
LRADSGKVLALIVNRFTQFYFLLPSDIFRRDNLFDSWYCAFKEPIDVVILSSSNQDVRLRSSPTNFATGINTSQRAAVSSTLTLRNDSFILDADRLKCTVPLSGTEKKVCYPMLVLITLLLTQKQFHSSKASQQP